MIDLVLTNQSSLVSSLERYKMLLLYLFVVLPCLQSPSFVWAKDQASPNSSSFGLKGIEPFFKTVTDQLQPKDVDGKPLDASIKNLMDTFLPALLPKTTTTTTTTTADPLNLLTDKLTGPLQKSVLFGGQVKALNNAIKGASTLNRGLFDTTNRVVQTIAGGGRQNGQKFSDDKSYYEYTPVYDVFQYREPKYFSRDCNFRVACEIGRILKPFAPPLKEVLESSKLAQDLQNRYTRAFSYGIIHEDCHRYFCLLVQFAGGPAGFASGVAELMNRIANPDMYN